MFHAASAALFLTMKRSVSVGTRIIVPAARPTRGSGLGAVVDMLYDGEGAPAGADDVEDVVQAAPATSEIARSLVQCWVIGGFPGES